MGKKSAVRKREEASGDNHSLTYIQKASQSNLVSGTSERQKLVEFSHDFCYFAPQWISYRVREMLRLEGSLAVVEYPPLNAGRHKYLVSPSMVAGDFKFNRNINGSRSPSSLKACLKHIFRSHPFVTQTLPGFHRSKPSHANKAKGKHTTTPLQLSSLKLAEDGDR